DCNFQNGTCTWRNLISPKDDFDWIIGSGGTPSSYTGPSTDRLGSKNGIVSKVGSTKSSPKDETDDSLLASPPIIVASGTRVKQRPTGSRKGKYAFIENIIATENRRQGSTLE
ncbi:hypothetical protein QZH41_011498, partial [Actinostola sp. cb2023]